MKIIKTLLATSLIASSLMAIEPIQKEAGWSGFILMGGGYLQYENNEVAGNRLVDVEDKQISNYGSPDSQSTGTPVITGTARYTLENKKTEFFIGNSLEDYLRMDATLALGVRHDFEGLGIMGVRLLASITPTEVWEDPFLKNQDRSDTERTSTGLGLKWESILGSNFEIDIRARKFEFDNDRNGESLNIDKGATGPLGGATGDNGAVYIDNAGQKLLEREGTMASIEVLYTWDMNKNNFLIPALKFTNDDRDGDARDSTRTELKLSHIFINQNWIVASSIYAGQASFDEENPIFQKKQDTDFLGGGMNITYKNIFGWQDWNLNGGFYASQGDSDIDFYDTKLFIATLGVAYSF